MNQPTNNKLHAMRLGAMADAWQQQDQDPRIAELAFDERFAMLVDAEHLARDNRRLQRLLREAKLRIAGAAIENVKTGAERGLPSATLRQLQSCSWLEQHHNILITGPTGVGKTYLACALGHLACRRGYRTLYRRLPRLADELLLAHADGSYPKLLARFARMDLLIVDDWGIAPLKATVRSDLLEIFEDRHAKSSTIITSQIPTQNWHQYIGEPTVADAIVDRILHCSHDLNLKVTHRERRCPQTHKSPPSPTRRCAPIPVITML